MMNVFWFRDEASSSLEAKATALASSKMRRALCMGLFLCCTLMCSRDSSNERVCRAALARTPFQGARVVCSTTVGTSDSSREGITRPIASLPAPTCTCRGGREVRFSPSSFFEARVARATTTRAAARRRARPPVGCR